MGDVSLHLGEFVVLRGLPGSAAVSEENEDVGMVRGVGSEFFSSYCCYRGRCRMSLYWRQYKTNTYRLCTSDIEPVDRPGSIQM